MARRPGRALGAPQIPVPRLNPLSRLFRFSRPYRARLAAALAWMLLYAAGTTGLAYLIKNVFDDVLANGTNLGYVAAAIVVANLLKGIGGYFSAYLMADVGQRVVMDVRNTLYRHILDQSAAFFARRSSGQLMSRITNDVGQIQQAVSETVGDLAARVARAGRLHRSPLLLRREAGDRLPDRRSAGHLPARSARATASQDDAPQPGRARAPLARERRGVHRTPHRQGVRHRGARGGSLRAGRPNGCIRANMKVTAALSALPPVMELLGGFGMAAALWYGVREIAPRRRSSRPASSRRSSRRCS